MPLTATPERHQPRARHLPPKRLERPKVSRNSMIVEVALHHRPQPVPGLGHPFMPALAQLLPHCLQFASKRTAKAVLTWIKQPEVWPCVRTGRSFECG
jgi:hypothetical protein